MYLIFCTYRYEKLYANLSSKTKQRAFKSGYKNPNWYVGIDEELDDPEQGIYDIAGRLEYYDVRGEVDKLMYVINLQYTLGRIKDKTASTILCLPDDEMSDIVFDRYTNRKLLTEQPISTSSIEQLIDELSAGYTGEQLDELTKYMFHLDVNDATIPWLLNIYRKCFEYIEQEDKINELYTKIIDSACHISSQLEADRFRDAITNLKNECLKFKNIMSKIYFGEEKGSYFAQVKYAASATLADHLPVSENQYFVGTKCIETEYVDSNKGRNTLRSVMTELITRYSWEKPELYTRLLSGKLFVVLGAKRSLDGRHDCNLDAYTIELYEYQKLCETDMKTINNTLNNSFY